MSNPILFLPIHPTAVSGSGVIVGPVLFEKPFLIGAADETLPNARRLDPLPPLFASGSAGLFSLRLEHDGSLRLINDRLCVVPQGLYPIPFGADVQAVSAQADAGESEAAARSDHVHPLPLGDSLAWQDGALTARISFAAAGDLPQAVSPLAAGGVSGSVARSDHAHPLPVTDSFTWSSGSLAPALGEGAAPLGDAGWGGSALVLSRADHVHPMGGTAGGDLNGTYPLPQVAAIQGRAVAGSAPADGEALIWSAVLASWRPAALAAVNHLINGGFQIFQRQAPAVFTNVFVSGSSGVWPASRRFGPDRWAVQTNESGSAVGVQARRYDSGESADADHPKLAAFRRTAIGRIAVYQILESINAVPLRGGSLRFECQVKAKNNPQTLRLGVARWNGSADQVPARAIAANTTWAANPELGANLAWVANSANINALTGAWTDASLQVDLSAETGFSNLIAMVYHAADAAANDELLIRNACLYSGSAAKPCHRLPAALEAQLCWRYGRTFTDAEGDSFQHIALGVGVSSTQAILTLLHPIAMIKIPQVVFQGSFNLTDYVSNLTVTELESLSGQGSRLATGLRVTVASGITTGKLYCLRTNSSATSGSLFLEAEI